MISETKSRKPRINNIAKAPSDDRIDVHAYNCTYTNM